MLMPTEIEMKNNLIDELAMLYRIKAAEQNENKVLNYEIRLHEEKLKTFGFLDFESLKP